MAATSDKVIIKPAYDEKIEEYLKPLFQQHYTMSFENYPVAMERVHGLQMAECSYKKDA